MTLILVGCSTPATFDLAQDQVDGQGDVYRVAFTGRLVAMNLEQTDSGSIQWQGDFKNQEVTLLSPIGSVVAVLVHQPDLTHLKLSSNEEISAANVEQLTNKALGYPLPLEGMPWWILGQPWPNSDAQFDRDSQGRLITLRQDDWVIRYGDWHPVSDLWLPKRIELVQANIKIRIRVDYWHITRRPHVN